jgi:hypothetical protein
MNIYKKRFLVMVVAGAILVALGIYFTILNPWGISPNNNYFYPFPPFGGIILFLIGLAILWKSLPAFKPCKD